MVLQSMPQKNKFKIKNFGRKCQHSLQFNFLFNFFYYIENNYRKAFE